MINNILSLSELNFDFFSSDSVLYCDFNSLPIKNIARDEIFIPLSGTGGTIENGRFNSALRMDKNTKLAYSGNLSVSSQMTFSFWINSINLGVVYDQSDPEIYYNIKMPLFGMTSWSMSEATQSFVINSGSSFLVYEKCYGSNENSIIIELYNNYGIYRYESDKYSVGDDHHFYIVYNGIEGYLSIYIDGIKSDTLVTYPAGVGSIPSSIGSDSGNTFIINDIAPGVSSSVVGNGALLEDLFICNSSLDNEVLIKKIINRSVGEVFSSSGSFKKSKQSLFLPYEEVSTNYLKSVAGNSSEIYLGSSYGDIYRGSSTLWVSRKGFNNQVELDMMKLIKYNDSGDFSFDNDGVIIDGYGIELE
jgi:hypothetical protein